MFLLPKLLIEVSVDYGGSSGAVMQTGQRIGTSVGIAMITAAVFVAQQAASWDLATIIDLAIIGIIVVVALFFAFLDLRFGPLLRASLTLCI